MESHNHFLSFYSNSSSKDKICGCVEDEDRTNLIRVEAPKMDEYYFVEGIFLTNNRLSKLYWYNNDIKYCNTS